MKKLLFACVILAGIAVTAAHAAEVPRTIAGITLGSQFDEYKDLCRMEFYGSNSDIIFLKDAPLKEEAIPGIRGGDIYAATCAHPGEVVRVKLKFSDRKKRLYESLLERYKDKFGEPDNYKGDAFRNVVAWEWLISDDTRTVNLTLMYSIDPEFRPGVSIKMTDETMLREDYECYQKEHHEPRRKRMHRGMIDLGDFVPE